MNCLIIDDDITACEILKQYSLKQGIDVKNIFNNVIDALHWLKDNDVDFVFLDLHMPKMDGEDFIKAIQKPVFIVMTTSDANFAVDAFNYASVVGYLLKPIEIEKFKLVVKNVNKRILKRKNLNTNKLKHNDLFINIDKRLIKLKVTNISVVQSQGDYVIITTENETYKVNTSLKHMISKLPATLFFQVHRSYIINLSKIIDIELNSILIGKMVVPIGRSKKGELMEILNLL